MRLEVELYEDAAFLGRFYTESPLSHTVESTDIPCTTGTCWEPSAEERSRQTSTCWEAGKQRSSFVTDTIARTHWCDVANQAMRKRNPKFDHAKTGFWLKSATSMGRGLRPRPTPNVILTASAYKTARHGS